MLYIIANRMKERLNKELGKLRAGFPGRGTRNQILNLKIIIEKNRERNIDLFLYFIDIKLLTLLIMECYGQICWQ